MIRTILELSSRNSSRRFSGQVIRQQKSSRHSSRKEFSSASPRNGSAKPNTTVEANTTVKPPESGSSFPKVLIGSIAVGAAAGLAYQTGYLDQFLNKEKPEPLKIIDIGHDNKSQIPVPRDIKSLQNVLEDKVPAISELPKELTHVTDSEGRKVEHSSASPSSESSTEDQHEIQSQEQAKFEVSTEQDKVLDQEKFSNISLPTNDQSIDSGIPSEAPKAAQSADSGLSSEAPTAYQKSDSGRSSEESPQTKIPDAVASKQPDEEVETSQILSSSNAAAGDSEVKPVSTDSYQHLAAEDKKEDPHNSAPTLLDAYLLEDKDDEIPSVSAEDPTEREKAFVSGIEELNDAVVTKDGKLILDFLQAIHAAEVRQAELDARTFAEEKRAMKEKYEKELKDAIARELMHAEEAALLEKEVKRERAKAAAAVKSLQQKLEEKHKLELEEKEREAELKLNKVDELAKAEMSAAIAREKASQIEKMAEANLHINALCMAFYARSEETRQSHSVHKLALGALALEDALSKGLPIKAEIEALQSYLHGIDKDSILDLVLSSLPEETISHGTESVLQLSQQFDTIKGTLQHYSLIPPGGGGILAHSLASLASWLKVQKVDPSGEGIESVISRVENYLAEGKLAEAADALEEGARGSQAADIIHSWVKQVRNRAIAEQALTLLQSYATSVSLT